MSGRLLIVSGSRVLAKDPVSIEWSRNHIDAMFNSRRPTLVLAGRASGPDTWAFEAAMQRKIMIVEFDLSGFRYVNGVKTTTRWHEIDAVVDDKWPLRRNDKMVAAGAVSLAKGWEVNGLFLRSAFARTYGTKYTLDRAKAAGFNCEAQIWGEVVPEISEGIIEMIDIPIVWFDLETGGKNAITNSITEIGAIMCDETSRRVIKTFEQKVWPHPATFVDQEAAALTGYSIYKWREHGAVQEVEMLERLRDWLPPRFYWGGYNGAFDRRFLTAAHVRNRMMPPAWIERAEYDPMARARAELTKAGTITDTKLSTVCKYFGISIDAHRALSDANAARLVYLKLRGEEPVMETTT